MTSVWNKRFCSRQCFVDHNRDSIRASKKRWEERNHPKESLLTKNCAHCSKSFQTRKKLQIFCSAKCRANAHYRRHKPRYTSYTNKYRTEHPEKARAQCRRYYAKRRTTENAKTRQRYALQKLKLAEAERFAAELAAAETELQRQQAIVEALKARQVGRPRTLAEDATKYLPRMRQLKEQNKTWGQITMIMNRETGDNRSPSGWRHIFNDSVNMTA
jgi:ribosomal protein L24E